MNSLDLRPSCIDITIMRNNNVALLFTLADQDGNAIDITGDTVRMTVKTDLGGTEVFHLENTEHTVPESGQTTFILPRDTIAAAALTKGLTCWVYEVRRTVHDTEDQVVHVYGELAVESDVGAA